MGPLVFSLAVLLSPAPPPWQDGTTAPDDETTLGTAPNERKKRELLQISRRLRNGMSTYYGGRWVPQAEEAHRRMTRDTPPAQIYATNRALADWYLREGRVEESIALLQDLLPVLTRDPEASNGLAVDIFRELAVANLRRAEQDNCLCERNGDSCIFPLSAAAEHTRREGAEAARMLLERCVELSPDDLECVWLLNLAHMALGTYPAGVPALHRIPPRRMQSELDLGRFEDVAVKAGLAGRDCAGGAVMDDFDGDGDLDLVTSSLEPESPMKYYRNQGDGTFEDVSAWSGLDCQLAALNFVHGDIDNDGRLDLYLPRGAWLYQEGAIPHSLVRQRPDGTFIDITRRAGIDAAAPSQVAAFGDIDNDGDLDLFVGCESIATRDGFEFPSLLYRNDGDLRFTEIGAAAGVQNGLRCKGAAFGDFDRDGFLDLYVSNLNGPNRLYHNQGDGTFVDRGIELGVAQPIQSFPTWWFDVNNDGWLDILSTSYHARDRTLEVAAYYKHGTSGTDSARVFLNQEGKGFEDVGADMGLDRPFFPMGANFGDLDNDGFQDLYFGTGDPAFAALWPNLAFRNDGGRRFQDATTAAGLGFLQKGHGVAFGDVDQDGDQDILLQLGGGYRDDGFFNCLLRNPGHGHHWLTVRLTGVTSNRFAIGATLRVRIAEAQADGERERDVYLTVGSGGSFGGNSLQAEMGLGDATRVVELEVTWPGNAGVERFTEVPLDRVIAITEGAGAFTVVETVPFDL